MNLEVLTILYVVCLIGWLATPNQPESNHWIMGIFTAALLILWIMQ